MVEEANLVADKLVARYDELLSYFPGVYLELFQIFMLSLFIIFVVFFIWNFYKSISKKDILKLNIGDYYSTNKKIFLTLFNLIEYVLLTPFIILTWFVALSIFIILLGGNNSVYSLMLINTSLIISIRFLAYNSLRASQDLANLFPYIALASFLLESDSFDMSLVISRFTEIPLIFDNIFFFFVIIVLVELILRLIYTFNIFSKSNEE
jgi:hypothetical protein